MVRRQPGLMVSVLVAALLGYSRLSAAGPMRPHSILTPPVWVFLMSPAVAGGATSVHTHHARHTRTAPFPVTYSYRVAVAPPFWLAYVVEIYALDLHARRAAASSRASAFPLLPLAHPAIRGAWLRGVVTRHYCALVAGAVFRNLLLAVNSAHAYAGVQGSAGCRHDIGRVLALEQRLLGRARGFAAHPYVGRIVHRAAHASALILQ